MDYKFFFKSLLKTIFIPGSAWDSIIKEDKPVNFLRNSFLYPFIILVSISAFLGSIIFSNATLSPVYSVFTGLRYFILFLFLPFAAAVILGEITKPLDLGKSFIVSFRLIVYSLAPFFICQVASLLFESLIFVNILSLYGLFIFWIGAEKILNPPDYKKMPLLIATFITVAGLFFAGNLILTSVIDRIYYSFFA
jgi:hypothetical protein